MVTGRILEQRKIKAMPGNRLEPSTGAMQRNETENSEKCVSGVDTL